MDPEALRNAHVIPDIIDDFKPSIEIKVTYGETPVKTGHSVSPVRASSMPDVDLVGTSPGCLYTMVMTDPDAPSPEDPKMREWVHWIVTNIPAGSGSFASGQQVLAYAGPSPPKGTHRYVFVVFEQLGGGKTVATLAPETRGRFNTRDFAAGLGLKPVGALYFTAHK